VGWPAVRTGAVLCGLVLFCWHEDRSGAIALRWFCGLVVFGLFVLG